MKRTQPLTASALFLAILGGCSESTDLPPPAATTDVAATGAPIPPTPEPPAATGGMAPEAGDEPSGGAGGTPEPTPPETGSEGGAGGAGGSGGQGGAPAPPGDWFDPAWSVRQEVTVTDPELSESLERFQIPVRLTPESFDYAGALKAGEDLRFVSADGAVLMHEIERWDPSGESLIWLMLPELGTDPVSCWLYSGNPEASAPTEEARRGVWPAPYSAVWHMAGGVTDSSPSSFNGENKGGTFADGKFGQGLNLSRPDRQHVVISPDAPIPIVSGAAGSTFSAWIYPEGIDGGPGEGRDERENGSVILTIGGFKTVRHNSYTGYNLSYEGRMITHVDPADTGSYQRVRSDPGAINREEWTWATYVVDLAKSEVRFYQNGTEVGTFENGQFNGPAYDAQASARVVIGTEEDFTKHFFDGVLDELRVEKDMRSTAWIAAQYRAMTVPGYVTIGAE